MNRDHLRGLFLPGHHFLSAGGGSRETLNEAAPRLLQMKFSSRVAAPASSNTPELPRRNCQWISRDNWPRATVGSLPATWTHPDRRGRGVDKGEGCAGQPS